MIANLHSHLEGRVRPATAAELAVELGLPGADWERALELDAPADLTVYLAKVAASYPFFAEPAALARITREAVVDAAADGQDYLELRFGPTTHVRPGTDLDAVVAAACAGLAEGVAESGIRAGLVLAALRHEGGETARAVAEAAVRADGVVGFDLAGDELRFPELEPYAPAFGIAAAGGLGLTCHAAEAAPGAAALRALDLLGVSRIGHGAHVAGDPAVLRAVAERGAVIEICPTSNVFTGAVASVAAHPAPVFVEAGVRVVLGDDNPRQTGSPLSRERTIAASLGVDLAALDAASLDAAFLTDSERRALTG